MIFVIAVPLVAGGWSTMTTGGDHVAVSNISAINSGIVYRCLLRVTDPSPPVYYAIDLITTKKIRGARLATGTGNVTYAHSPFGVSINRSGSYVYDLDIQLERIDSKIDGQLVAWVTTTDLKDIRLLGVLDESLHAAGRVEFNKYLVVITLEPHSQEVGESWTGPVVLRGISRSGLMHTKAGHGPFQTENCASYGFS